MGNTSGEKKFGQGLYGQRQRRSDTGRWSDEDQRRSLYNQGLYLGLYDRGLYVGRKTPDTHRRDRTSSGSEASVDYHQQEIELARGPFNQGAFKAYVEWVASELGVDSYQVHVTDNKRVFTAKSMHEAVDRMQRSGTVPRDMRISFPPHAAGISATLRFLALDADKPRTYARLEGESRRQVAALASLLKEAVDSGAIYGATSSGFKMFDPTVTHTPAILTRHSNPRTALRVAIGMGVVAIAAFAVYLLVDSWEIAVATVILGLVVEIGGAWFYDFWRRRPSP